MNNGNITKKTKKELAEFLGVSVKTMRESVKYTNNFEIIEKNVGAEKAEMFEKIISQLKRNNKAKISAEQIKVLSMMSADIQINVIDRVIAHPENAKRIINNEIPFCKTKVTVTLPDYINEWYINQAEEKGVSKIVSVDLRSA